MEDIQLRIVGWALEHHVCAVEIALPAILVHYHVGGSVDSGHKSTSDGRRKRGGVRAYEQRDEIPDEFGHY